MIPRVSVVTPTYRRTNYLRMLCRLFKEQTWPEKELIILDDSPEPDGYLKSLTDSSIRYVHMEERGTIGEKRHRLAQMATGEVIAQFDDDDYYAPTYLATMIEKMGSSGLVTLSAWFGYDQSSNLAYYWDTGQISAQHWKIQSRQSLRSVEMTQHPDPDSFVRKNQWGYGFSYVFTKKAYERVPYDRTLNRGEDYDFVRRLMEAGIPVSSFPDEQGLAIHVIHQRNTAAVFPNYLLPRFVLERLFGHEGMNYIHALSSMEAGLAKP